jgi:hypothetical protein
VIDSKPFRPAFVRWTLASVLFATAALSQPATTPENPAPGANPEAPAAQEPATGLEVLSAEQTDEQGRAFRLLKIPKRPGEYKRDKEWVRFRGGHLFEVVSETETEFVVKHYLSRGPARERVPKPAPPDLEAIARSYEISLPASDRLRLEPFDRGLPREGQWRNGFDVVDFDADGSLEILFGAARKGRLRPNLFRHQGHGEWTVEKSARFAEGRYDYGDARAADLNGDGRLDVVFGMHLLGLTALVDNGEGKLVPWNRGLELTVPGTSETAFSSRALQLVDWNGDGRKDLVALGDGPATPKALGRLGKAESTSESTGLRVYLNRGDGSWELQNDPNPDSARQFGDSLAVGDLDRDGDPDLLAGVRRYGRPLPLGIRQADGSIEWKELPGLRAQAVLDGVAISDFDRDGWNDLVVAYRNLEGIWRSNIDLYFGGAEGWTRRPLFAREGNASLLALATGDVNGDGLPEVVAFADTNEALLFVGQGGRQFSIETTPSAELGVGSEECSGYSARIADLDGDGRGEILAGFAGDPTVRSVSGDQIDAGCGSSGSLRVWKVVPSEAR